MLRAFVLAVLALMATPVIAQSWYNVEVLIFARDHGSSEEIWPADLQPRYASQPVSMPIRTPCPAAPGNPCRKTRPCCNT